MNDVYIDFIIAETGERILERFDGSVNISLKNQVEIFYLAGFHFFEQAVQTQAAGLGQIHRALFPDPVLADLPGIFFIGYRNKLVAG